MDSLSADGGASAWSPRKISQTLLDPNGSNNNTRKLSATRGVNLPDLKLFSTGPTEIWKEVAAGENAEGNMSPPMTSSPVGHFLRQHPLAVSPAYNQHPLAVSPVYNQHPLAVSPAYNQAPEPERSVSCPSGSNTLRNNQILDICIFLPDQKGLQFSVNCGKKATADQLHQLTTRHLGLNQFMSNQVFALWMRSPILEIQLKPHHCPFQVRKQWLSLLSKFTNVAADVARVDEPLLVFSRNVMLSKSKENLLCENEPKALELLYQDCRYCILTGRYPTDIDFALKLAAIDMALLMTGPYHQDVHTHQFFKERIEDFLPEKHWNACRGRSVFGRLPGLGCKGREDVLCQRYKVYSLMQSDVLIQLYIELCQKLPYYGSALFYGQIERPPSERVKRNILWPIRLVSGNSDLQINIAISRHNITVIDCEHNTVLLVVNCLDCSWRKVYPHSEVVSDVLPSFFLHFSDPNDETGRKSKLLQIFTKQAVMMEAMLNSCFQASTLENDESPTLETAERRSERDSVGVVHYNQVDDNVHVDTDSADDDLPLICNKLNRLCLASFDESGKCLQAVGTMQHLVHE